MQIAGKTGVTVHDPTGQYKHDAYPMTRSAHGFDFIMLVMGLIHFRLNEAVKALKKPGVSTFEVLVKAGYMRMVQHDDGWKLHNTRTKVIELFEAMGFTPDLTYLLLYK